MYAISPGFSTGEQNMRIRSTREKAWRIISVHATRATNILSRGIEFHPRIPWAIFIAVSYDEERLLHRVNFSCVTTFQRQPSAALANPSAMLERLKKLENLRQG